MNKKKNLEYFQYLFTGFLPFLIKITSVRNQSTISFVVNWGNKWSCQTLLFRKSILWISFILLYNIMALYKPDIEAYMYKYFKNCFVIGLY